VARPAADGRVLPHLRTLTTWDPLNEGAHARLMITLASADRQADALRAYEQVCRRLDDELGVLPGPALRAAHMRVLRQDIPVARLFSREEPSPRTPAAYQGEPSPAAQAWQPPAACRSSGLHRPSRRVRRPDQRRRPRRRSSRRASGRDFRSAGDRQDLACPACGTQEPGPVPRWPVVGAAGRRLGPAPPSWRGARGGAACPGPALLGSSRRLLRTGCVLPLTSSRPANSGGRRRRGHGSASPSPNTRDVRVRSHSHQQIADWRI
jgi:Bacterial transcriptional activator domain